MWKKCRHFVRNNTNQQHLVGIDSQPNNKVILFITFFLHCCVPTCLPACQGKKRIYGAHMFMLIHENQTGIRLVCSASTNKSMLQFRSAYTKTESLIQPNICAVHGSCGEKVKFLSLAPPILLAPNLIDSNR